MGTISNWRTLILSGAMLLLVMTACQTAELTATREAEPPTGTVAQRPTPDPSTLPAETATPENVVPTPTQAADPPATLLTFGLTMEPAAFKGDPNAPVVIIEFSDYQ